MIAAQDSVIKQELLQRKLARSGEEILIRHQSQGLFTLFRADVRQGAAIRRSYIIKQVDSTEMGRLEEQGLKALGTTGCAVPETHGVIDGPEAYLILDFVETGTKRTGQETFEKNLEALYRHPSEAYGWHEHNFIGPLIQRNTWHQSFADFWWQDRIHPQASMAKDRGYLRTSEIKAMEAMVFKYADSWELNRQEPRLVHGDLWSGNVIVGTNGQTFFIDPSVAYSHPEQDIAMLLLFGSPLELGKEQYERLQLQPGTGERIPYFQLYPLLVHVNIFGASYVNGVKEVLRKYR